MASNVIERFEAAVEAGEFADDELVAVIEAAVAEMTPEQLANFQASEAVRNFLLPEDGP